jgi:hypothetical protein
MVDERIAELRDIARRHQAGELDANERLAHSAAVEIAHGRLDLAMIAGRDYAVLASEILRRRGESATLRVLPPRDTPTLVAILAEE